MRSALRVQTKFSQQGTVWTPQTAFDTTSPVQTFTEMSLT